MLFSVGRSSAPNSAHTEEELAFLHAVEFSDVASVKRLMAENPKINVNVIDALGRTALRLAVRNENRQVEQLRWQTEDVDPTNKKLVELLVELSSDENIYEAVLQAISEDHTTIAEQILKHPCYLQISKKRKRLGDEDGFFKMEVESQFSTDMTPINLAAQKNNFVIVQLLLQRGDNIQKPDKFDCNCMECRNRMKFDQLRMANFRLNAYRGLASEAYISLSSDDPFLTAFQLAKELRTLSNNEVHFKKEYRDLAGQLSDYAVKLLDRVWTQEELNTVLQRKGSPDTDRGDNLARLKLALTNKEKKFVAHPSVQQYLARIWHQDLHQLDTLPVVTRLAFLVVLSLLYPFIAIAYIFKPDWKYSQLTKQPMVKFMGHTLSFLIFLLLIIISSKEAEKSVSSQITLNYSQLTKQPMVKFMGHTLSFLIFLLLIIISSKEAEKSVSSQITLNSSYPQIAAEYRAYREELGKKAVPYGEDFPLRPREHTVTEHMITIWVAGMVILQLQKLSLTGVKVHFRDLFNVVEFILLIVYIAVLVLFSWTIGKSQEAAESLRGRNCSMLVQHRRETDLHLYWLNTDRTKWLPLDPINVAEELFSMGNILSFSRIFYLLPAIETLGPMQISLRRMINDILKIMVFAIIAVSAFIVSLRNLYSWYNEKLASEGGPKSNETNAASSFLNIRSQFITVFWWLYGRGRIDQALDLPEKYPNGQVTEFVGQLLAAAYHVIIIIVFVNLLIAMMARSFEKIVGDADAEWKYARSLLYMEYIDDTCATPIPINMLQLLRDVIVSCVNCVRSFRREDSEPDLSVLQEVFKKRRLGFHQSDELGVLGGPLRKTSGQSHHQLTSDDKPSYKDVVQMIVQRYMFDIQREEENNTGNLEEARQTICQTKWDLLDLMDKRDHKVAHLTTCLQALSSELSTLTPTRGSFKQSIKRQKSVMSFMDEEEEQEQQRADSRKGATGEYPKTSVILSTSGM